MRNTKQSANQNELYPNENVDVPDPYFGMTNGFEIVYTMLDEVCDIIADKLIAKHIICIYSNFTLE
jgi:protein-tyrosine-phosphatase